MGMCLRGRVICMSIGGRIVGWDIMFVGIMTMMGDMEEAWKGRVDIVHGSIFLRRYLLA